MIKARTLVLALGIGIFLFGCEDNSTDPKALTAEIFNAQTLNFESDYLKSKVADQLSEIEKEAITVRQEEIREAQVALAVDPNVLIIYGVRCQPRPPVPCPGRGEAGVELPPGSRLADLVLGTTLYRPNPDENTRTMQNEASIVITTTDGKKVCAHGVVDWYDPFFQTSWFKFVVVNSSLMSKPLLVKVTTQILVNNQVQEVTMNKTVPANTFIK